MDQVGPAPHESVTALAAHEGLGDWAGRTYLAKKAMFSRKWEDARLHIFVGGVIVIGPGDFEGAYGWGSSTVLQDLSTLNGAVDSARYTLINRDGNAVGVGRGRAAVFRGQLERLGARTVVQGAPFTFEGEWGPLIQTQIARAQLPDAIARVERGETVEFGAITVSRQGLSRKNRSAAWEEIGDIAAANGMVDFCGPRTRSPAALPPQVITELPNLELFFRLCRHLNGST